MFEVDDYIYVPGIRTAMQKNELEDIKAYVIKDGKATEISLYCKSMTENEREIVQAGCLINFNRGLKK
jgi:aconitate hydratase